MKASALKRVMLALALAGIPVARAKTIAWIRTSIPGFTVYSDLPESETRRRLASVLIAIDDFQRLWTAPRLANVPPGHIVFCGSPRSYASLNPEIPNVQWLAHRETDLFLNTTFVMPPSRFPFPAPPWANIWGDHLLQRAYGALIERHLGERTMPWLNEGLAKLTQSMVCDAASITIPALATDPTLRVRIQTNGSEASLQDALSAGEFLPLDQLFATAKAPRLRYPAFTYFFDGQVLVGPGNRGFASSVPYGPFIDEAYEFTVFALFGENGRYRQAFVRFAQASANGPPDEAAFQRTFGIGEPAFLRKLWGFTAFAQDRAYPLPSQANPPPVLAAELVFRPATQPELAAMTELWRRAKREPARGSYGSRSSGSTIYEDEIGYEPLSLY